MSKVLTKTTNRKFYNKWLYKVTVRCGASFVLRYLNNDIAALKTQIKDENFSVRYAPWVKDNITKNKIGVLKILDILEKYPGEWGKRIEGHLDIYTNNIDLYNELSEKLEKDIFHRYEPDGNTLDLLDECYTIIGKKLPHNKYQYRVYLTPHKIASRQDKESLLNWLDNQKPRVTLTDSVKHWFIYNYTNWDRRYILVEDEGTLMMLKLRQANAIGKVYKYVVSDK